MTSRREYEDIKSKLDTSDIDQDFWLDYNQEVYRILDDNEKLQKQLEELNEVIDDLLRAYINNKNAVEYINTKNFWGLYEDTPMVETLYGSELLKILDITSIKVEDFIKVREDNDRKNG